MNECSEELSVDMIENLCWGLSPLIEKKKKESLMRNEYNDAINVAAIWDTVDILSN